jgi:anti-sigma regulatory factor (Ser/Thr protein kinase)
MPDPLRHEALPYDGRAQFVACCSSLVTDALTADHRPLVLAEEAKLGDVRDALGADSDDVTFVATDEHGRNPNRLTALLDSFQTADGDRRAVGISEPVNAGRSSAALAEAQLGENLVNVAALSSWALDLICLYDRESLDAEILDGMRRAHPVVRGERENTLYDPDLAASMFRAPLPPAPQGAASMDVARSALGDFRAFVRGFADACHVPAERTADLVLAANEVVTNSLRHGGGTCQATLWQEDSAMVCDVRDDGHITDPVVGRLPPSPDAVSGRGLWLANHLCDVVQIRSSPSGTTVRLIVERL